MVEWFHEKNGTPGRELIVAKEQQLEVVGVSDCSGFR